MKGSSILSCGLAVCMALFTCSCSSNGTLNSGTAIAVHDETEMEQPSEHSFGPGDQFTVYVWRNDDLKRAVTVDANGRIDLPLIGEVNVAGRNVETLRSEISAKLATYLVDPKVDIAVTEIKSRRIHVLGYVNSPGTFLIVEDVSVWEAISKAGGLRVSGNKKNVLVMRREGQIVRIRGLNLDIENMSSGGTGNVDYTLQNGDVVFVPPTTIAKIESFMTSFANILSPITGSAQAALLVPAAIDVIRGVTNQSQVVVAK